MQWSGLATIGYNDHGNNYYNHPLSGSVNAQDIACVNSPQSPWNNVMLDLTAALIFTPPPPTFSKENAYGGIAPSNQDPLK